MSGNFATSTNIIPKRVCISEPSTTEKSPSKAISPNEPYFHPLLNEHAQWIPPLNTDTHLLMKASIQQHVTQNLLQAQVEPQLQRVQFHSPLKSNILVPPAQNPKQSGPPVG